MNALGWKAKVDVREGVKISYDDFLHGNVRKFPMAVRILQQLKVIQDIWKYPGYNFEKLEGTNQYSMRLDRTWRLIMEIDWTNEEKTVGIIGLEDLSHHYQ